jgi:lysozyme family protein
LHIIPGGDLSQISVSLTSGASAVVALAYALLQFWLNKRSADGVNTVKAMLNQSGGKQLKLNGVIGNATVEAASKLSGANVTRAMALAGRPSK